MPFHFQKIYEIEGLQIIKPKVFKDARGFFMETYKENDFLQAGIQKHWKQDNLSFSIKGTLRGLHFQKPPYAQAKLVTALQGTVLDVVVDLRKNSPTYGKYYKIKLSDKDPTFLFIPEGFAHGFVCLSETCLFYYKCSEIYNQKADSGIRWNSLNIDWEIDNPIISEKDKILPLFEEFKTPFI